MPCSPRVLLAPPGWSSFAIYGNNQRRPQAENDPAPRPAAPANPRKKAKVRHASFVFSLHGYSRNCRKQGLAAAGGGSLCYSHLDEITQRRVARVLSGL